MLILSSLPRSRRGLLHLVLLTVLAAGGFHSLRAQEPALSVLPVSYTGLVVFGDSLSDTGNVADTVEDEFFVRYPSPPFNYADGRFTSSSDTNPANTVYEGVWHEQLCKLFLGLSPAKASLDGGTDYAFGDAETLTGQRNVKFYTDISIHIDNLGRQVANYFDKNAPDPGALFIVWCGANDLFAADATSGSSQDGDNAAAVTAAANVTAAVERLARGGAYYFLVNNLPPVGETPEYRGHPDESTRLNNASATFRDALNADLDDLLARLTADGITIDLKRMDVYDLFTRLLATSGAAYGFDDITHSAQDASVVADHYLFWDGVHPTAAGHFQLAAEAFSVLTGIPVVEVNGEFGHVNRNAPGAKGFFFLTRTGPDLSTNLPIYYSITGTAVPGQDYQALRGIKHLPPGVRTGTVTVIPYAAPVGTPEVNVELDLGSYLDFQLPAVGYGRVRLDAD